MKHIFEEGVFEQISPVSGEVRWQAIAKIKGTYTLLGWYPTHKAAMKAYTRAATASNTKKTK